MEEFGLERQEWLKTFLELPNGIPDSDTFRRVFAPLPLGEPAILCKTAQRDRKYLRGSRTLKKCVTAFFLPQVIPRPFSERRRARQTSEARLNVRRVFAPNEWVWESLPTSGLLGRPKPSQNL
jgi:hypothetical protein